MFLNNLFIGLKYQCLSILIKKKKSNTIQHLVSITCPQTRIAHLSIQPRKPTSLLN